ncbi:hypothetical protein G897_04509 [Escherichia coli KOEGE 131 (358a)]|nr:hypothetical protein G897_04509 [Escherichia coli KOEGE 131 (358a)]CQE87468.1 Uncharacterised protein [Salmonella enterica subsp. enterica serovar Typhimurium str. DT104]
MFNKNKTHIENKAFMVEPFRDPTANECNVVIANDICIRVACLPLRCSSHSAKTRTSKSSPQRFLLSLLRKNTP